MDDTLAYLRDQPYYEGQIRHERTLPGREATLRDCDLDGRVASALEADGITDLYGHQAESIAATRGGENVVLATETASGKSLAYTVPAFERGLDDRSTTLYVAPQVALINDQTETLAEVADRLGFASGVSVAQYTGRQSRSAKKDIRDRQPTVLLTTPDMLHYGILPHANRLWDWFFERLETVVIDEVHEYRGVFGSHVSLVMRRLSRVADRFDAEPEWICCSATIGNPVEHAATVTGQSESSFHLVDEDESASGPRHWVCWNPPEYTGLDITAEEDDDGGSGGGSGGAGSAGDGGSGGSTSGATPSDGWGSGRRKSAHVETMNLFVDLVQRGLQTVVFTRSRQTAERYASNSADTLRDRGHHDLARNVGAYQAALTDERRRQLEEDLKSGKLRGVWSTNALELGVDVGGLDAVVLDGYPGTRMQTFQQGGRAGRGTDPALVILVGGEDQLDQYVMNRPEVVFDHPPERAVTNPENEQLLPGHVQSAAFERWLRPEDDAHFGPSLPDVVTGLEEEGALERRTTDAGIRWLYDGGGSPQQDVNLRTIDEREVTLKAGGDTIAKLGFGDALRDAHPGAIYHHQGTTYEVTELDLDRDVATLDRTWANYFTRTKHDKSITVEEDLAERTLSAREDVPVRFASVTMRKQITGYERRDSSSGELIGERSLDLPETSLSTKAYYFTVPRDVERAMLGETVEPGTAGDAEAATDGEAASDGETATDGEAATEGETVTDGGSSPEGAGGDVTLPDHLDAGDLPGGIHAAEHAMISMMPFEYLCDRRDIGGLSTPVHPHTERATIFVYDGYPGGVGLAKAGYRGIEDLMAVTLDMLRSCDCADGCPACVQSPHCGNGNDPLDKGLAGFLLDELTA